MNFQSLWRLVLGTSYCHQRRGKFVHRLQWCHQCVIFVLLFPSLFLGNFQDLTVSTFLSSEEINGPPGFLLRILWCSQICSDDHPENNFSQIWLHTRYMKVETMYRILLRSWLLLKLILKNLVIWMYFSSIVWNMHVQILSGHHPSFSLEHQPFFFSRADNEKAEGKHSFGWWSHI